MGQGYSKGPKNMGGPNGSGGKVTGGGTRATLQRIAGGDAKGQHFSLSHFARMANVTVSEALTEVEKLAAAGEANFTYFSPQVASVLRAAGTPAIERDGRAVRGFTIV